MDILRKTAEADFDKYEDCLPDDESPPRLFKVLQLDTVSGETVCQRLQLRSNELGSFLKQRSPPNQQFLKKDDDESNNDGGLAGNHSIKFVLAKAGWGNIVEDTGKMLFRKLVTALRLDLSLL